MYGFRRNRFHSETCIRVISLNDFFSIIPFCSSNSSRSKCSLYVVPSVVPCRPSQILIPVLTFSLSSLSCRGPPGGVRVFSSRSNGYHQRTDITVFSAIIHQAPRHDSAIFRLALKASRELWLLPFASHSPYRQLNLTFLFLLTIHKFHQNITLPRLPTISLPSLGLLYQFITFPWVFIASHTPKFQAFHEAHTDNNFLSF